MLEWSCTRGYIHSLILTSCQVSSDFFLVTISFRGNYLLLPVGGENHAYIFNFSFTDISCLSQCPSLAELTLDGNPLSNCLDHRHSIISHLHCLKSLDQLPILVGRGSTTKGVILKGFTEEILLTPDVCMLGSGARGGHG